MTVHHNPLFSTCIFPPFSSFHSSPSFLLPTGPEQNSSPHFKTKKLPRALLPEQESCSMNQSFSEWLWQHFWSQLSVMKLLPNNYQFNQGKSLIRGQCCRVFVDRGIGCLCPRAALRGRMSPECEESCAFITFAANVLFTGMRTSSWEFVCVHFQHMHSLWE